MIRLRVVPLETSLIDNDGALLDSIAEALRASFSLDVDIGAPLEATEFAYDAARKQHNSPEILKWLLALHAQASLPPRDLSELSRNVSELSRDRQGAVCSSSLPSRDREGAGPPDTSSNVEALCNSSPAREGLSAVLSAKALASAEALAQAEAGNGTALPSPERERGVRENGPPHKILAVTNRDLYIPMLSFVYGQAQLDGIVAIISLARLRTLFYGLSHDAALLDVRARKEAIHEVGHLFGLVHCPDTSCAMTLSTGVTQLDHKQPALCTGCTALATSKRESLERTQ